MQNSPGLLLRQFLFSTSVAYFVISSALMALNSTNMPTTPKFMSTAQISPVNSRLVNLTDDSTSPLRDKYLKYNMSKIKSLIFSMKTTHPTVSSISVTGHCIFPVTRARHIKLILHMSSCQTFSHWSILLTLTSESTQHRPFLTSFVAASLV